MKKSQLISLIKEETKKVLKEAVEELDIHTYTSDEGNKQIAIRIKGAGLQGGELILSSAEATELQKLAKEFLGSRIAMSTGVNTKDDAFTQSTIGIRPDGLRMDVYRKEGSQYRGYDSSTSGEISLQQSAAYQLADKLGSFLEEAEEDTKKSVPSDVANLAKAQSTSTALLARQKNINSIAEFPGAFETWFKTLGYEPGKINKGTAIRDVNAVLTKLGYK